VSEVAALAAAILAVYTRAFPDVAIGAIEPTDIVSESEQWKSDLGTEERVRARRQIVMTIG
jgi:hypothetical protein